MFVSVYFALSVIFFLLCWFSFGLYIIITISKENKRLLRWRKEDDVAIQAHMSNSRRLQKKNHVLLSEIFELKAAIRESVRRQEK